MIITVEPNLIKVKRERQDKPVYRNSLLWYKIKRQYNGMFNLTARHALVKKKMSGHLSGQYYLITGDASRKVGMIEMIYDPYYQVASMYKTFNSFTEVKLIRESFSCYTESFINDFRGKLSVELIEHGDGDDIRLTLSCDNIKFAVTSAHTSDYKKIEPDEILYIIIKQDVEGVTKQWYHNIKSVISPFRRIR
jgi:hypothetical protein